MSDFTLAWHGREFFGEATKAVKDAMTVAAITVESKAKKIMGTGASMFDPRGNTKIRRGKRAFHRPSAPGFPPAVDTGVLRASISHKVTVKNNNVMGFVGSDIDKIARSPKTEAGTDVEYGFYLEVGTKNMEKRPWLRPALRQSEKTIKRVLKEAVAGR